MSEEMRPDGAPEDRERPEETRAMEPGEIDDSEYENRHGDRPEDVDFGELEISYETREADVFAGVEVCDRKNKIDAHRNIELLGVFVVIWMFWKDLFRANGVQTLISWVMVLIALALLWMIFKLTAANNRKYAARLCENSPRFDLVVTREGIDVTEGGGSYRVSFSDGCAVYDYMGVYAVCHERNRVFSIPKDQLGGETEERLRGIFRQALGDRFEKVYEQQKRPLFRKKK